LYFSFIITQSLLTEIITQSSHWITAVNVAAFGIGFVPIGEVIAVSIAINLAAGFAMEIQQRQR
jgi:hypothetical protein